MKPTLYEQYTRRQVHDLFDPASHFTPQAGTWGLHGIVPVPSRIGDFVFFVTFGQEQAGHKFEERISEDGVINWQSQPRQSLSDRQIQQFIHHDPVQNTIYLFLRTEKTGLYTYLGRLAYYSHDPQRERPVWIQWHLLDWPIPRTVLDRMGLTLRPTDPIQNTRGQSNVWFEWRGLRYDVDLEHLWATIRKALLAGASAEAARFRDWFVEIDDQRIPAKWIFHLITGADYSEFDAPTARDKLKKIGILAFPVRQVSETSRAILQSDDLTTSQSLSTSMKVDLPERKMFRTKFYKAQTIRAMTNLILDLAQLGEISLEGNSGKDLHDYHVLQLIQSGWAIPTPYALVATPRMLGVLPIPNRETLRKVLRLADWDTQGWAGFDQKAFHMTTDRHYPKLSYDYIYTLKTANFTEDPLWRPVWLVNYLPEEDWDDWEVLNLMHELPKRREKKLYVHSVIPIQNVYGGLTEAQDAVWKSALYWLMLQLLILSDPETGALYDPQISLHLSEGWRDGSAARLFLQGEYIGELADCLPDLMAPFKWVWVNRSDSASENNQACLGLLRLLLKIEIAELAKDGRLAFTDPYRRQLFENQAKARLHYLHSKESRDKLRETIKEMAG